MAMMMASFKYSLNISAMPMAISNVARAKRQIFGGIKPRHNLQTVDAPISSAGLRLGKNFNIPK